MSWMTRKVSTTGKRPSAADLNTTIWRYMGLPAFLGLINEQCLMFHQFQKLREADAREGMLPVGSSESVINLLRSEGEVADEGEMKRKFQEGLDRLCSFQYANCWNMAPNEDALMWTAYAPTGIAIKTTVGKLTNAELEGPNPPTIKSQVIEYADNWDELERRGYAHDGIVLAVLFSHTKRTAFSSEKEIRFSIQPTPKFPKGPHGEMMSADHDACPEWYPVVFKNLTWVEEAVVAPSIRWAEKSIRWVAEQKSIEVRPSDI